VTLNSFALPCTYRRSANDSLGYLTLCACFAITALIAAAPTAHAQLTGLAVQQSPAGLQVILHDSQQDRPITVQTASYDHVILKLEGVELPPTLMVNTEDAPLVTHVLVEQQANGHALITLQGHKLSNPTLLWQVPAVAQKMQTLPTETTTVATLGWLKPMAKQILGTLLQPVTALAFALLALLSGVAVWAGRSMASVVVKAEATISETATSELPHLPAQSQGLRFGARRYATQPVTARQGKTMATTQQIPTTSLSTTLPASASIKQSQGLQRYGQVASKAMTRPSTVRTLRDAVPTTGQTTKASQATYTTGQTHQQPRHAFLEAMVAHAQSQGHANLVQALRLSQR
jgi:hypothetical protein